MISAGVNVQTLQVMPLQFIGYQLRSSSNAGGIHVRRSPFEEDSVDLVFFDRNGRDLPIGATRAIERLFFREEFPRVSMDDIGTIDYPVRIAEAYTRDLLDNIDIAAIKKEIEDSSINMRGKYEDTMDYIGQAAPVSIPG